MKRLLGLLLALTVMVGMSMPSFGQDTKKDDTEHKGGKQAATKKTDKTDKNAKKKAAKKDGKDKKDDKK